MGNGFFTPEGFFLESRESRGIHLMSGVMPEYCRQCSGNNTRIFNVQTIVEGLVEVERFCKDCDQETNPAVLTDQEAVDLEDKIIEINEVRRLISASPDPDNVVLPSPENEDLKRFA